MSHALDEKFRAQSVRVSKVDGGESWVAFGIKPDEWLLFSWGTRNAGICAANGASVSALKKSAPARTPLVEFLKSQLLKGQLSAARQLQNDRVIEIECSRLVGAGFANNRFIILEATEPSGNFLLLDDDRTIMELARHSTPDENKYRTLLPGHIYSPPPPFGGLPIEEIRSLDFFDYENVRNIKGVGRPLAELIQSHWEERTPSEWLEALQGSENIFQATKKGCITSFPIIFPETIPLGTDALIAAHRIAESLLEGARNRLLSAANKGIEKAVRSRQRHLDGLQKQLNRQSEAEGLKLVGQLLLENIAAVPPRAEKIALETWDGGSKIEIALDPALSAVQNAERYFKKYRKAQNDQKRREELKTESESLGREIEELSEQKDLLAAIDDISQLESAARDVLEWISPSKNKNKKQKKQKEILPPHLRFDIGEAVTILVGLNARGNRFVTFKQAGANDLWLHAHELPGAHVIIKGKSDDDAINFAASLAAFYSKGKNSARVSVDCTQRRNVRSIHGNAIAHVTYTNPRVINIAPGYWKTQEAGIN